jgi:hypothetical protein
LLELKYPSEDKNKLSEIEDMAGKQNRIDALAKYKEEIRAGRRNYDEVRAEIYHEFKQALFVENGMENHPKKEAAFSKAWQHGHSSGLKDVEYEF